MEALAASSPRHLPASAPAAQAKRFFAREDSPDSLLSGAGTGDSENRAARRVHFAWGFRAFPAFPSPASWTLSGWNRVESVRVRPFWESAAARKNGTRRWGDAERVSSSPTAAEDHLNGSPRAAQKRKIHR